MIKPWCSYNYIFVLERGYEEVLFVYIGLNVEPKLPNQWGDSDLLPLKGPIYFDDFGHLKVTNPKFIS